MILYRILIVCLAPAIAVLFAVRALRRKETRIGLAERLALRATPDRSARIVWMHGASLGEITAARPLIMAILSRDPALGIVVTMNTYTARDMVRGWGERRLHARMAPLDYRIILHRFFTIWSPRALIVLENELWPNRLSVCQARDVPVLVAGGRMSDRALSVWRRFGGLSQSVADAVTYLAPLDDNTAARFESLGVDPSRIGPALMMKSSVTLPDPDPADLDALRQIFDRDRTVLAASTHDGEDALILRAFVTARALRPGLRLILAPRHPERAAEIAKLILDHGLTFRRRSNGDSADADVLLADTLGEMALWYSLAGITLIGGTWIDKGGHTPFEPAQFGSAVIFGPSIRNHARAFQALQAGGGSVAAADEAAIAQAILDLGDATRRVRVAQAADRILAPMRADAAAMQAFADKVHRLIER